MCLIVYTLQQVVASVSHYCTHCTSIAPVRLSHRSGRISEVFSTELRQTSASGVPLPFLREGGEMKPFEFGICEHSEG